VPKAVAIAKNRRFFWKKNKCFVRRPLARKIVSCFLVQTLRRERPEPRAPLERRKYFSRVVEREQDACSADASTTAQNRIHICPAIRTGRPARRHLATQPSTPPSLSRPPPITSVWGKTITRLGERTARRPLDRRPPPPDG